MKNKVFFFAIMMMSTVVFAQSPNYDFFATSPSGQFLWYKINADSVSVTLVRSYMYDYPSSEDVCTGNVVIPDTVYHNENAYAVTTLGENCFSYCGGITSIHIPATVTSLEYCCLFTLSNLNSITVDTANPVYDSRDNCNAVIHTATNTLLWGSGSTVIPNSVVAIEGLSFEGNKMLTTITIPPSVTIIKHRSFIDNSNLSNIIFQGNDSATLIIDARNFIGSNLTSLYIPAHIIGIGANVFGNNPNLTSIVVDPNNTVYDSRDNCNAIIVSSSNLLKVGCVSTTIPGTVTSIASCAHIGSYSDSNVSIIIPEGITGITCFWGESAYPFVQPEKNSVTFPVGFTNLGITVTSDFGKLIFLDTVPPALSICGYGPEFDYNIPIVVPCGSLARWQNDPVWGQFTNITEPNTSLIAVNAEEHGTVNIVTYPSCGNNVATVIATADSNYHFTHWSDGSTQNPYSVALSFNTVLTASFAIDSVTVSVSGANEMGYAVGGGTVALFDSTTVTAVPNADNIFLCWNNGVTANPYTLIVNSDTTLTALFTLQDTVILFDTTYVDVHDTTYVDVHDTTYVDVHDTTYVDVHDTTYVDVHDTTYVDVHDTTYVDVHDTTYVDVHDTTYVDVHDTTYVDVPVHDTTILTDTLLLTQYDTVWLTEYVHDTVYIHDTVYVGVDEVETVQAKVYVSQGRIVVEGAEGYAVTLYDVTGRVMERRAESDERRVFDVPATGAYLVKIGNLPARKIVVVR